MPWTVGLFLQNQDFTETCDALIRECQSKLIPHIKEVPARLVVLRPSLTETVRIAHTDPKRPYSDGQVQADFPLPFPDKSCVLEGSVYAMPETHPSSKYVSLFIAERDDALKNGKFRVASAPNLGVKDVSNGGESEKATEDEAVVKTTKEDERPIEDVLIENPSEAIPNEDTYTDCAGLCADNNTIDCMILKQAGEYFFIQRSCPFSCTGPCSQKTHSEDEDDKADGQKASQQESAQIPSADKVPIQVIHDIIEAITPQCSAESIEQEPKNSFRQVKENSSVQSPRNLLDQGVYRSSTEIAAESTEENIAHSSIKSFEKVPMVTESPTQKPPIQNTEEKVSHSSIKSSEEVPMLMRESPTQKSSIQNSQEKISHSTVIKSSEEVPMVMETPTQKPSTQSTEERISHSSIKSSEEVPLLMRELPTQKSSIENSEEKISHGTMIKSSEEVPMVTESPTRKPPIHSTEDKISRNSTKRSEESPMLMTQNDSSRSSLQSQEKNSKTHGEDQQKTSSSTLGESVDVLEPVASMEKIVQEMVEPSVKENDRISSPPLTEAQKDYFPLDYVKLKQHLREGDSRTNRKILQALRWRLAFAKPEIRNGCMVEYSRNDVLGLREKNVSVVEEVICPVESKTPNRLQEEMARLINTVASLTLGREYLCQKEHFLARVLIPVLLQDDKCPLNGVSRCHLLVTLQKLSLRNKMRKIMISAGLPGYIVSHLLAKHKDMSRYCLEYTTALFMNLCLHQEARDQLKQTPGKVVDLMMAFLDFDHDICLPYLNGSMYSVFIEPKIRSEAINRKLDRKIEGKINGKAEDVKQQMQIILNILKLAPSENYCTECDCSDQDEEVDHLEAELSTGDEISNPKCEAILAQFRKAEHCKVLNTECLRRPVTPLQKAGACNSCKSNREKVIDKKKRAKKPKDAKSDKGEQHDGRVSPRESTTSKSRSRSHLSTAELNSIYFQQRHSWENSNLPTSYTRTVINSQDKASLRADQAKACSFPRPCVFYKNYKVCYRNDLSHFSGCTTCQGHPSQNRYRCDCYEEMKALIDQLESEDQCSGFVHCRRKKPNLLPPLAKLENPETPVINLQPAYNELLHSLRRNLCVTDYCTSETNCTVHCECYNLVFQSRPKVNRTP